MAGHLWTMCHLLHLSLIKLKENVIELKDYLVELTAWS